MRFIGRFLWLTITFIAIILAMVFAVSNTQTATLRFWPLSGQIDIAVWALTVAALTAGALFGGSVVWLSLIAARTRNWRLRRALGKAETRAAKAEDRLAATESETPSASGDIRRLT